MKYIAIAVLVSLILGLPTVNFQHHLNLPVVDKYKILSHEHISFSVLRLQLYMYKVTDIRLNDELKSTNTIKDIANVLVNAEPGDIINFHLAGYGGDSEAMFELINLIHKTKATVNMIVEGNVYSAHAYLATQGNTLTMLPYTFMMFHTGSNYGYDCSQEKGTDRTVSNVEHCLDFMQALNSEAIKLIESLPFITPQEKASIETGHDLYISSEDYKKRISNE